MPLGSEPTSDQLPSVLRVVALVDPVVEAHGFVRESLYVEYCWLPILGPTATLAYRRLGTVVAALPPKGVVRFDLIDLSLGLGLGEGIGRNSVMARTLRRLVQFGVAEWRRDTLAVRRALAPLTARQLGRLGYTARIMHERIAEQRDHRRPR